MKKTKKKLKSNLNILVAAIHGDGNGLDESESNACSLKKIPPKTEPRKQYIKDCNNN